MSKASSLYIVGYVLDVGLKQIGLEGSSWVTDNDSQKMFLTRYFPSMRGVLEKIREIVSLVSRSADAINTFLAERGFSITVRPFDSRSIGIAAVQDITVEWKEVGERTTVRAIASGERHPAVRLTKGVNYYTAPGHAHPIAMISTVSGDIVCMTKLDGYPDSAFALDILAENLTRTGRMTYVRFGGLVFPMVNLNTDMEMSWMLGMQLDDSVVTQAVGQFKFRMNEKGARAQSAVAIVTTRAFSAPAPDMVIDGPFLMWIIRPSLGAEQQYVPLCLAHITEKDWSDPGDLSVA